MVDGYHLSTISNDQEWIHFQILWSSSSTHEVPCLLAFCVLQPIQMWNYLAHGLFRMVDTIARETWWFRQSLTNSCPYPTVTNNHSYRYLQFAYIGTTENCSCFAWDFLQMDISSCGCGIVASHIFSHSRTGAMTAMSFCQHRTKANKGQEKKQPLGNRSPESISPILHQLHHLISANDLTKESSRWPRWATAGGNINSQKVCRQGH